LNGRARRVVVRQYGLRMILCSRRRSMITNEGRDGRHRAATRPITVRDLLTFTFGFGSLLEMFIAPQPWPVIAATQELRLATIAGRPIRRCHRAGGGAEQRDGTVAPHSIARSRRYRADRAGCWTDRTRCPGNSVADSTTRPACSTCSDTVWAWGRLCLRAAWRVAAHGVAAHVGPAQRAKRPGPGTAQPHVAARPAGVAP